MRINTKGTLGSLIVIMVAILVVVTVFLALWNPSGSTGIRDVLYNLINDSDFTTTYGTGIRDALVYLIDLIPLAMMLGGVSVMAALVVKEVKAGGIKF